MFDRWVQALWGVVRGWVVSGRVGPWRRRLRGVLSYGAGFLLGILVGMSATHAFG